VRFTGNKQTNKGKWMTVVIHFFCLHPLDLSIKLNSNTSKVAFWIAHPKVKVQTLKTLNTTYFLRLPAHCITWEKKRVNRESLSEWFKRFSNVYPTSKVCFLHDKKVGSWNHYCKRLSKRSNLVTKCSLEKRRYLVTMLQTCLFPTHTSLI